jgi:hypothetical protein
VATNHDLTFHQQTYIIAYDAVVDGVHRKAVSHRAKSVHPHRAKKLEAETFLYKIPQGIIDTHMVVAPLSGATPSQDEATETVGTIELRLYITRQLGVDYAPAEVETYNRVGKADENGSDRPATFKLIYPTFHMAFEENSAPLDDQKSNTLLDKLDSKRPGTQPWAIFRFHYRSQSEPLSPISHCQLTASKRLSPHML